ncbi:uncharacterized protein L203_104183 [Cryptococcus depauperatus CBS 7841]|uniref:Uncharacterized protein n=1 Tax=Cryptococcus depauperatus CBS 7841 TaxID=1295531 RepID=A0A1E3HH96_9TREE|nr:hypothetical protein L203_06490 [Cryptococcus depauperatus CBS 7841]
MIQTDLLAPGHSDLVTHIAYDYYGESLATCSADQRIKVFRKDQESKWRPEADWKAHDAPILHLSFSHPTHGSLLASSSIDRTVRIWEAPSSSRKPASTPVRWIERGVLTGPKGAVRSVEWAPADPGYGVRVGFIATDGYLRVCTSLDPSLSDWSEIHSIHIPSYFPLTPEADNVLPFNDPAGSGEQALGGWALSWCKERWWGSLVAACAGTSPITKIISLEPSPKCILTLVPLSSPSPAPLTCLSWAPSCGRSYHLVATGSRDGTVSIWRIQPPGETARSDFGSSGEVTREWKAECVGEFGQGGAKVCTVDWNATGTILSTTDDEGIVRIYKPTYARTWKLLGKLTAEEPGENVDGQ